MIKWVIKIFLVGIALSQNVLPQGSNDLFPEKANGWNKYNPSKTYTGDKLFVLIDGGADLFFEYGFKQVITQRYINGERSIDAEIYEMNDSSSAFGIFSLQTFRTGERIKFNSEASAGEGFMLFWKGKYYVSLSMRASETSAEDINDLLQIANAIDSKMKAAGKPELAALLSEQFNTKIVYVKGNLGLYNLHVPEVEDLVIVKEGFYFEKDSVKIFTFLFESEDDASKQFSHSYEILKSNSVYKQLSYSTNSFTFQNDSDESLISVNSGKYLITYIAKGSDQQEKLLTDLKNVLEK